PALCLPLLIIFSLLGGALYLTGRNPFMGFNLGGARVGRHIRYQARGRGYSLSVMSVVSAAQSIAGAAKAIKKGGMKELAKQESAAAKGRVFLAGDIMKVSSGISAASSAAKVAGRKGAKSGDFARHMEARMGSGSGGSGPQQQQQSGTSMAMAPTGGGIRASELVVKGNYGAQVFGSLGKMMLFFAMNTTLGRCVDGLISVGQGWTENGRERGIYDMLFVRHSARAQEDLQAIRDMMVSNERGEPVGIRVTLPGGVEGTVRSVTPNRDGSTTLTLAPAPGSTLTRGDVQVTISSGGVISSMTFTVQVPMQVPRVNAQGQPVDAQGHVVAAGSPQQVMDQRMENVSVTARRPGGENAPMEFTVSLPPNASRELVAAVGLTSNPATSQTGPVDVRVNASNSIYTVGQWGDAAHPNPVTLADVAHEALPGAMYVGMKTDLLNQCQQNIAAMREMNGSFQNEVAQQMRENRDRVESAMTDESRTYLGGVREREATRQLATTLGISETQLASGSPLLTGLSGDRTMGGSHGAAIVGISDAYRSSELGSSEFAGSLAGETRRGVAGVSDEHRPMVQAALGQVISSSGANELTGRGRDESTRAADAERLRGQVIGNLTDQVMAQNPRMSRDDATTRATQMVSGLDFQAIDRRIDTAVASFDRDLANRGFSGDMRREILGCDVSQVARLASYGAPAADGGTFRDTAAMLQNQGRLETGGDTYQINPGLRAALNEHAHLEAMQISSSQLGQSLTQGSFGPQSLGQVNFIQQQNLRYADAVFVSGAQQAGTPQQYGVEGDLFGGTSQLALSGAYAARMPHPDPGEIQRREEEESRARQDVQAAVLRGDLARADAIVAERVQTYSSSGNTDAAQGWGALATSISTWRNDPHSFEAVRNDPTGMGLSTLVPEMHPAGPDLGGIARRDATVEILARQEYGARQDIAAAFQRDDYRTAESLISQQVQRYRELGDERTALAYEVALIQVSGLRREVSDNQPGSYWDQRANFQNASDADKLRMQNEAESRILNDIGFYRPQAPGEAPNLTGLVGSGERVGQDAYQRVGTMERNGDVSLSLAADRVNEESQRKGAGRPITGLTYGRESPPAP
ncbi:MAG TPA: hypothetical protein VLD37_05755, partial [Candidatus Bilamarchaeum sp.]|nr:hypothetical protein [Candidatus Bilamarchaeum sp.]